MNTESSMNRGRQSLLRIRWILLKEFASFPGSGSPAISLTVVVFLAGLVSVVLGLSQGATYEQVTALMIRMFYILTLVASVFLTMNTFVAEKRQGTLDLLYTLPVTDFDLVTGKILMNFSVVAGLLLLLDAIYIVGIAETPLYQAFAAFVGLLTVAYYAVALGVFASSVSESPFMALLIAVGVIIAVDIGGFYSGLFPSPAREIFSHFHAFNQFLPFARGVIPLKGTVLFLSGGVLFHFLAVKALEFRRFRGWN